LDRALIEERILPVFAKLSAVLAKLFAAISKLVGG
jgi:hypothetical protein